MGPVSEHKEVARTPAAASPMGRYGPLVSITRVDVAPRELEWQLPLQGELYRLIPGPDRPDYSLLVLERPLHFYPAAGFSMDRVDAAARVEDRKGRPMVRVHALLVCSRFVGQQLAPGMRDLAVTIAYVIDTSLAQDPLVDFAKVEVAAVGFISEGHVGAATPETAATATAAPETAAPETAASGAAATHAAPVPAAVETAEDVVAEAARALRDGVAAHRGRAVEALSATLVVAADHRLGGLSGNADGEAPVPTPDTFDHVNEVLARLGHVHPTGDGAADTADDGAVNHRTANHGAERRFHVRVEGDTVTVDSLPA